VFTQPGPAGATGHRRDQVIYYQYRAERARRTLRGIDEQVATAEKAVAGKTPVKRNRFIRLSGGTNSVSRLRQLVEHAPLPGVTPAMCLWYLERVDRQLTWAEACCARLPVLAPTGPHLLPAPGYLRPW